MKGVATPIDLWRAGFAVWSLMAEAQAVIALRCLGAMGMWTSPPGENLRMVAEKQAAFAHAARAGMLAHARGDRPDLVTQAIIKPLRRKTTANVARLTKAGPLSLTPPKPRK